jgi:hypothetical protein
VAAAVVVVSLLVALVALAAVAVHLTLQVLLNQTSPVALALEAKAMLAATASSRKAMHSVKAAVVVVQVQLAQQPHPLAALELVALVFPTPFKLDHHRLMAVAVVVAQSLMHTLPVVLAVVAVAHLELAARQRLGRQIRAAAAAVEHPTVHKTLLAVVQVSWWFATAPLKQENSMITHHFSDGLYAKQAVIPAGTEASFECSKCGACCRKINCQHITDDNLCSIYETRPLVCNIEKGHEVFFSHMSKEDYYRENKRICIILQEEK